MNLIFLLEKIRHKTSALTSPSAPASTAAKMYEGARFSKLRVQSSSIPPAEGISGGSQAMGHLGDSTDSTTDSGVTAKAELALPKMPSNNCLLRLFKIFKKRAAPVLSHNSTDKIFMEEASTSPISDPIVELSVFVRRGQSFNVLFNIIANIHTFDTAPIEPQVRQPIGTHSDPPFETQNLRSQTTKLKSATTSTSKASFASTHPLQRDIISTPPNLVASPSPVRQASHTESFYAETLQSLIRMNNELGRILDEGMENETKAVVVKVKNISLQNYGQTRNILSSQLLARSTQTNLLPDSHRQTPVKTKKISSVFIKPRREHIHRSKPSNPTDNPVEEERKKAFLKAEETRKALVKLQVEEQNQQRKLERMDEVMQCRRELFALKIDNLPKNKGIHSIDSLLKSAQTPTLATMPPSPSTAVRFYPLSLASATLPQHMNTSIQRSMGLSEIIPGTFNPPYLAAPLSAFALRKNTNWQLTMPSTLLDFELDKLHNPRAPTSPGLTPTPAKLPILKGTEEWEDQSQAEAARKRANLLNETCWDDMEKAEEDEKATREERRQGLIQGRGARHGRNGERA